MKDIYHVGSRDLFHNLWRMSVDSFRIIEYRDFSVLMVGSDYTLIDESLKFAFDTLDNKEVEIKKVVVKRVSTNEEWSNYYELDIKNHINPDSIKMLSGEDGNIWQYKHSLFVSAAFKTELEKLDNKGELFFSIGFSHWAGD